MREKWFVLQLLSFGMCNISTLVLLPLLNTFWLICIRGRGGAQSSSVAVSNGTYLHSTSWPVRDRQVGHLTSGRTLTCSLEAVIDVNEQ